MSVSSSDRINARPCPRISLRDRILSPIEMGFCLDFISLRDRSLPPIELGFCLDFILLRDRSLPPGIPRIVLGYHLDSDFFPLWTHATFRHHVNQISFHHSWLPSWDPWVTWGGHLPCVPGVHHPLGDYISYIFFCLSFSWVCWSQSAPIEGGLRNGLTSLLLTSDFGLGPNLLLSKVGSCLDWTCGLFGDGQL